MCLSTDGVEIKNGVEGIHMSKSPDGLPNGEALVELLTEEDVKAAEKKHNEHIGRRYIEGKTYTISLC